MSKKNKPEQGSAKPGRIAKKAANITVDMVSATVSTVLKAVGTVLLILLVTGMMFACVFAYYVKTCLTPNLDLSLEDFKLNESSTIWYQDSVGEWRELATLSGKENRIWVDYDQIPWYMEKALVSIEDKRFYEHKGVDWYRTAGAFVTIFTRGESGYGGSTITQQLIKNLTGEKEVTIQRKLTEIFSALELEKKYDKQEIMEWYLNAVYFGEGCFGVQTAAQTYFGKDVSELSLAECASIVGITNLPTYYDPFYNRQNNKERQETILREMYEQGYIDYTQYRQAVEEELVFTHTPDEGYTQEIMSYYTETVIDDVTQDLMKQKGISEDTARTLLYNGGYQIYSCLDADIQASVDAVYSDLSAIPQTAYSDQQLQSAIVIMDPFEGKVLALCGGVGEKTINLGLNRATGTYRSPGSSIKPIASYGPAVDLGLITPGVRALIAACGFLGMDVVQFVDGGDPLAGYQPRPNKIAYTGTHDNQTLVGYAAARYPGLDAAEASAEIMRKALASNASICIVPLQDVLGLGDEARMNTPGTAEGNWRWQADAASLEGLAARLRQLSALRP